MDAMNLVKNNCIRNQIFNNKRYDGRTHLELRKEDLILNYLPQQSSPSALFQRGESQVFFFFCFLKKTSVIEFFFFFFLNRC